MKRYRVPSYVDAVLAYLRKLGALVIQVQHAHRFRIVYRFRGKHGTIDLPIQSSKPNVCAARAKAEIQAFCGVLA